MLSAGYNTQTQTVTVTVTVTLTVNVNVTVTGMDGVLKTLHDDIANRKMPAKAHNFHLRVLVEVFVCVCVCELLFHSRLGEAVCIMHILKSQGILVNGRL